MGSVVDRASGRSGGAVRTDGRGTGDVPAGPPGGAVDDAFARRLGQKWDLETLPELTDGQLRALVAGDWQTSGIAPGDALRQQEEHLPAVSAQREFRTAVAARILLRARLSADHPALAQEYADGKYRLTPFQEEQLQKHFIAQLYDGRTAELDVLLHQIYIDYNLLRLQKEKMKMLNQRSLKQIFSAA
jgi:hypothetical protein